MPEAEMNPNDYWSPWEKECSSFEEVQDLIQQIFDKWSKKGRLFAWRGQVDASWALHSSLYRRLLWSSPLINAPREEHLAGREGEVLADVHRWGLHMGRSGRLSILNQLALLQHYGAPTRLIDVTFNPLIGLWFATEEKRVNGNPDLEDKDGRLFAIDVTDRLINENKSHRFWADNLKRPWPGPPKTGSTQHLKKRYEEWQRQVLAWRPPHFDERLAAQNGGFIFGGVPTFSPQFPKSPDSNSWWKVDEVRRSTSLAIRAYKIDPDRGGVASGAIYTIRIKADVKKTIRDRLDQLFGYSHATLFRDFTGFSSFATPNLKTHPG
ncbi:MAG: FRG domain-containing protein [Leptospirillia bacterium]